MDGRRLVLPCIALVGVILFLPFLFGLIPSRPKPLTTSSAPATDFTEVQTPERIEPLAKAANPEAQVAPAAAQEGSAAQEAAWGYFPLPPAPEFPDGAEALTPAYAKQLWTEALPLPPKDNPSVDLVVSRCVEDQKWIGTFAPQLAKVCQLRVLVYEKCLEGKRGIVSEQLEPFHLVKIALPNVGYEGHTFLHHLIASSTFPDLVFFLQGHDPRVHMRTANIDLLTYFRCIIQQPQKFLRNGFRYVSDERWEFFTRKQACWEGYYQAIFEMPDCPDILGTLCCSAFILTKERIAAIPRGVFERAMRFMNGTVLPVKLRSPVNAEDHKAQRIFDKIQPQQFWTNYEANCKTPPGSKLGYCAGAVARHKIEGVQIEHLWQAMLGEPFWLPPNVFPEFEPRQLRSHLWKLKDPKVKDQITEKYEKAFGEQYRAQIFSRGQMGLGMIEQHLKYKPLPVVQC